MSPRYGLLLLIPVALFVAGVFVLAFSQADPKGPNPLKRHAPCLEIVSGPTPEWACSDAHVYAFSDGRWVDAGHVTPLPKIPR